MSEVIWIKSYVDFLDAISTPGRVVVDFTAPAWCVPCQRFAPHYERAAAEVNEVKFLAVDVDLNEWAMVRYGVRGVPTVKLFENGTFVRDVKAPQGALPFINDIRS